MLLKHVPLNVLLNRPCVSFPFFSFFLTRFFFLFTAPLFSYDGEISLKTALKKSEHFLVRLGEC